MNQSSGSLSDLQQKRNIALIAVTAKANRQIAEKLLAKQKVTHLEWKRSHDLTSKLKMNKSITSSGPGPGAYNISRSLKPQGSVKMVKRETPMNKLKVHLKNY